MELKGHGGPGASHSPHWLGELSMVSGHKLSKGKHDIFEQLWSTTKVTSVKDDRAGKSHYPSSIAESNW